MSIEFLHLNPDWNAEPNAPYESVSIDNYGRLVLEFLANPWAYDGYDEEEKIKLIFTDPEKYRLGETNDEGWYSGQCRFGKLAPKWGEFYQIVGSNENVKSANDWMLLSKHNSSNHYLFYLRDNTFECIANSYEKT